MNSDIKTSNTSRLPLGIVIGVAAGFAVGLLLTCVFSLIMTIRVVPDFLTDIFACVIAGVSSFVCGGATLLKVKCNGLINGIIAGVCFFAIHTILSLMFGSGDLLSVHTGVYLAVDVMLGALGGILAVNL